MNRRARLLPSQLLLLGLLALLVFGSCGGGVNGFLNGLGPRQIALRKIWAQEQRDRDAARHQLRGRARLDAYDRIDARTEQRLDSLHLDDTERRKLAHRPNKIARRLRSRLK